MINVVVPVSGGKDSQACMKLAVDTHGRENVLGLFNDTGWEHPKTYAHIEKMEKLYGVNVEVTGLSSVESEVKKAKRFPAAMIRFCTDRLKIMPAKKFYSQLMKKHGPANTGQSCMFCNI